MQLRCDPLPVRAAVCPAGDSFAQRLGAGPVTWVPLHLGMESWLDSSLLASHIPAWAERGTGPLPSTSGYGLLIFLPVNSLPVSRPDFYMVVSLFFLIASKFGILSHN